MRGRIYIIFRIFLLSNVFSFTLIAAILDKTVINEMHGLILWTIMNVPSFMLCYSFPFIVISIPKPFIDETWSLPTWNSNFFKLTDPLPFLHFAGWFFLIGGLGASLGSIISLTFNPGYLWGVTGGVGMLLGVRRIIKKYKHKYVVESCPTS